jgi:hypothetical protein
MEVHHHSHHPKKIKEYITEFLMLFIAVTMGFFAENIREHAVTEHKMRENYSALVEDLKQDASKIQTILDSTEKYEDNMVKFKYILFKYHKHQSDWTTLKEEYSKLGTLPTYSTLFINNTTFKNMQSSGLLSYVEQRELKSKLSYYYEVVFKRLEDNNKLFDQAGISFFQTQIPHRKSVELSRGREKLLEKYPSDFSNKINYANYILELPSTKQALTSESLIYGLDAYSGRYYNYHTILNEIKEKNIELIQMLKLIEK